jgi:hypothetical protein
MLQAWDRDHKADLLIAIRNLQPALEQIEYFANQFVSVQLVMREGLDLIRASIGSHELPPLFPAPWADQEFIPNWKQKALRAELDGEIAKLITRYGCSADEYFSTR